MTHEGGAAQAALSVSGVPRPALKLRPYQERAVAAVARAYRGGKRAICLVCPTGGGKTLMGSRFVIGAVNKGARQVWWLAHRDELVEQARARLEAEGAGRVGIIAAGFPTTNAPLQVASIQTLAARAAKGLPSDLDLVVFDECHHLPAASWIDVVRALRPQLLIGLTATPERGDGVGLGAGEGGLFDELVQVTTVRELQDEGHLVPCVTYAPASATKNLSQDPVAAYLARAPGERAFVFCATVAHAEKLALQFMAQGVPATTIHANTPPLLRRARLEAFRLQDPQPLREAGSLERPPLILCNVYTLTEGVDVPEATCAILARGAGHPGIMLQMVGRVLRPAPGKTRAVFVDLRGVVHKLGLPEADREWGLEGKAAKLAEKDREAKLKPCPACGGMVGVWATDRDGWRVCPLCRERVAPPEPPKIDPRELHQMGRLADPKVKAGALKGLARAAARRYGNRKGWVAHRYREKFGDWPPFGAAERALRELGIDPQGPARPAGDGGSDGVEP
jgi:superfamily II DNA or RNA helicase